MPTRPELSVNTLILMYAGAGRLVRTLVLDIGLLAQTPNNPQPIQLLVLKALWNEHTLHVLLL